MVCNIAWRKPWKQPLNTNTNGSLQGQIDWADWGTDGCCLVVLWWCQKYHPVLPHPLLWAFYRLSACAGRSGRQAASPLQIFDACMQPRFEEFRQISSNTLCVPEPIFQQLDSWFSAMFVLASLLVDVVFRASSRVPSPRTCGEDCVTWNFLSRTRASSRLLELHAILHEPHCFPALRR